MTSIDKWVPPTSRLFPNTVGSMTLARLASVLLLTGAHAANWYVRQGATGSNSGSDWINAWTNVTQINWTSVSPGDNIWITGGTYGKLTIGKSGATNNVIYIARVRSTNAVPASAPGWNATYDSRVTINLVTCVGHVHVEPPPACEDKRSRPVGHPRQPIHRYQRLACDEHILSAAKSIMVI